MAFNSFEFLVFFPIVVLVFFIIPRKARRLWLLAASYYFYMRWNAVYAALIAASTLVTYLAGIFISKVSEDDSEEKDIEDYDDEEDDDDEAVDNIFHKKFILISSIVINLGILFYFKYFNFILDTIGNIRSMFGGEPFNPLDIILPVGISFYTFQAIGYTIDVYRGDVKAEKNFIKYALFVSFFPQLVAGPIERSGNLLSQISDCTKKKQFNYENLVSGVSLMAFGMFQKMVIADRAAIFVDGIFGNLHSIGFVEGLFGAMAFSVQVYCDFAGYSAIAIGAARVMGFELMENFNTPFFAVSIADHWRRWHISLSQWLRDYLYIPLGGNRVSKPRHYFNIMVTFLVSGLWHGANWTYVIWGGLHGLYQVIGDILKPVRTKVNKILNVNEEVFSYKLGQIIITYLLLCFSYIFFRAKSIGQACTYIRYMFTRWDFWSFFNENLYNYGLDRVEVNILLVAIIVLILVDIARYKTGYDFGDVLLVQNLWFRWLVLIVLVVACVVYGEYGINFDSAQFIYFQF